MLAIIKLVEEDRFDRVAAQALADVCSQSEDLSEGLLAIREKRAPVYLSAAREFDRMRSLQGAYVSCHIS